MKPLMLVRDGRVRVLFDEATSGIAPRALAGR